MSDSLTNTAAPYATLDPNTLLDAIEQAGFEPSGGVVALNSYENRVYQIELEAGGFIVAKFYRPGRWTDAQIAEEHAFAAELVEDELPIVAPLSRDGRTVFEHQGYRFALYPRQGGHAPDIEVGDNLKVLARTLARIHAVGGRNEFENREPLSIERLGVKSRDFLLQANIIPLELEAAYASTTEHLLQRMQDQYTPLRQIRIHGDCHLGNLLWRDDTPHFVDFDDTVMGPPIQDLWMLLSGERDEQQQQLDTILEAYRMFYDFDQNSLSAIATLRTLRIMHHAAWIARRWEDPAFPLAFPWFAQERYWSDHILTLREQMSDLDEPSLI